LYISVFFWTRVAIIRNSTFLLIGYDFFEVLNILLPYSIVISFLQIFLTKDRSFEFGKKILIHSVPFLILGLIIIEYIQHKINFALIVSIFLIVFSVLNLGNLSNKKIKLKNINFSLKFLGLFHGLTNLGGSLLSIISTNIHSDKNIIRYKINFDYLRFIWLPIIIFIISQRFFKKINDVIYYTSLNILSLLYGIYIFADII